MRFRILVIISMLIMITSSIVVGCSSDDSQNKDIAMQVAHDWTSEEVDYITDNITSEIYKNTFQDTEIPVDKSMLSPIIREQVSDHVTWTYSEPEKLSGNAYEVRARTILTYEIPQIGSGSVDVSFNLTCATSEDQKEVTSVGVTYYSFEYTGSAAPESVILDFDSLPTGTFVEHQEDGFRIHWIGFGDYQTVSKVDDNHILKDSNNSNLLGAEIYIDSLNGDNFYFNSLEYNNFSNNDNGWAIDVWAFPYPFGWGTATHIELKPTSSSFSILTATELGVDEVELCQLQVNILSDNSDYSVDNISITPI